MRLKEEKEYKGARVTRTYYLPGREEPLTVHGVQRCLFMADGSHVLVTGLYKSVHVKTFEVLIHEEYPDLE